MNQIKRFLIISISFASLAFVFFSCGQTEEDLQYQVMLLGDWYAVDNNGDTLNSFSVPEYHFDTATNGFSTGDNSSDDFRWEVRKGQIKIFYERAPSYYIGYDKYNSQSLMKLNEITEDWFEVTQFYSDGFQSDLKFHRISEDD